MEECFFYIEKVISSNLIVATNLYSGNISEEDYIECQTQGRVSSFGMKTLGEFDSHTLYNFKFEK